MAECGILGRKLSTGEPLGLGRPEWIILSSSSCPWRNSFKIEHHLRPPYEQMEIVLPETNVHFFSDTMKAQSIVEWRVEGSSLHRKTMQAGDGDVGIMAKDTPVWGRCFSPSAIVIISFSTHFLELAARDSIRHGEVGFKSLQHIEDRKIRALGSLLETEASAGCPTGRIYGEYLGMALATYLIRNYAVPRPKTVEYTGGLAKHRLRHVVDYIKSNLAEENSLEELANIAEVSPFHFCRSFKRSMGLPPHKYILQLRIEEAVRLLGSTELGISEIGKRVGFSDQSHFTVVFRKLVGTTPSRWRACTGCASLIQSRNPQYPSTRSKKPLNKSIDFKWRLDASPG